MGKNYTCVTLHLFSLNKSSLFAHSNPWMGSNPDHPGESVHQIAVRCKNVTLDFIPLLNLVKVAFSLADCSLFIFFSFIII